MNTGNSRKAALLWVAVLFFGGSLLFSRWSPAPADSYAHTPHKIHLAFGFHVNLYHSFRIDTNDEDGFGKDIRIIRHIIKTLDDFNAQAVPVKAHWDFDNLFSLQEILPHYGPDIISDIQRRVKHGLDEVLLMSYNNGMVSAMTRKELTDAVRLSISNPHGSGVKDLFGTFAPIVRPQEMMTTPGNFSVYKQFGIDCVSLYYSATPFDAIRAFTRPLSQTEAYNPLVYHNPQTGEEFTIIPTYHIGDLMENVGLRQWVEQLRRDQQSGKINQDVLLFLNFDADSEFWSGVDLPWPVTWLPNTSGLKGLIESVKDLPYVEFAHLSDYLEQHPPQGKVQFGQDTADGSFNGYNSWSEKTTSADYWRQIVANRRAHDMAQRTLAGLDPEKVPSNLEAVMARSYAQRLRALSTTNFGMATPVLPRQREKAMEAILAGLNADSEEIRQAVVLAVTDQLNEAPPSRSPVDEVLATFLLMPAREEPRRGLGRWLSIDLAPEKPLTGQFALQPPGGAFIPVQLMAPTASGGARGRRVKLHVPEPYRLEQGIYHLVRLDTQPPAAAVYAKRATADKRQLRNEFIQVRFSETQGIAAVDFNGLRQLEPGSLIPYITHQEDRYQPDKLRWTVIESGENGMASVRLQGVWDGPAGTTSKEGFVDYRLTLLAGVPYLFVAGQVVFPTTAANDLINAHAPVLARKIDAAWIEAAPVELRFAPTANHDRPFRVLKRNFLGIETDYAVDYFRHDDGNLNVDNVNNHVTAEYVGFTTGRRGMAVAMNTTVAANFAFCPLKVAFEPETRAFSIRANPFGTYHGEQLQPPTWGNRLGHEATLMAGKEFASAAPTYNGHRQTLDLMVAFFDGPALPDQVNHDLIAFARPPHVIQRQGTKPLHAVSPPNTMSSPRGFLAMPHKHGVLFHWEAMDGGTGIYRIRCGTQSGRYTRAYTAPGDSFFLDALAEDPMFQKARNGYAVIERLTGSGLAGPRSAEIVFPLNAGRPVPEHKISLAFQVRVLWENINALL
jgi:hypothetical protein